MEIAAALWRRGRLLLGKYPAPTTRLSDQRLELLPRHLPVLPSQVHEARALVTPKDSGSEPYFTAVGRSDGAPDLTSPDQGTQIDGHVDTNRPDTASP